MIAHGVSREETIDRLPFPISPLRLFPYVLVPVHPLALMLQWRFRIFPAGVHYVTDCVRF